VLVVDQLVPQRLLGVSGPLAQLLLVATHMQVRVVGAPIGQPMDQPRVAVECEDNLVCPW
jgi:hypothetical protein